MVTHVADRPGSLARSWCQRDRLDQAKLEAGERWGMLGGGTAPGPHVRSILQEDNRTIRRHAKRAGLVMLLLLGGGAIGYHLIEGWPLFDALYMTVITLSTIGYGETHPLSDGGRLFTVAMILMGVGNLAYVIGASTEFFAAGGLEAYRRRARMERTLATLENHTIICGYGRLGSAVAAELELHHAPFVVVERSEEVAEKLAQDGNFTFVHGDAGDDEVLLRAGIERAQALVAALNDDATNVFLTLTARVLNPRVVIYGKADDPTSLVKLARAGANHQFSPALVAGNRVAHQILRPAVNDLVGILTGRGRQELSIEEVIASRLGIAPGALLSTTPLWGKPDLMVLAIKTADGTIVFPPRPDYVLGPDDRVVVMGKPDQLAHAGVAGKRA